MKNVLKAVFDKYVLKVVFDNVFWPAAAGNVFWTFCNLVFKPEPAQIGVAPRLLILFFFSVYLTISWLRLRMTRGSITYWGWFFDFLHLLILVFASLSAQLKPDWLEYFLLAYFSITVTGHISSQWKLPGDSEYLHYILAAINAVGVLVLVFGEYIGLSYDIRVPGSFVLVFALWLIIGRGKEIAGIGEKLRKQEA